MKISPVGMGINSLYPQRVAMISGSGGGAPPWVTPTLVLSVLDNSIGGVSNGTYGRLANDGQYYQLVFPNNWVGTINDDDTDPFKAYRDADKRISKTVNYIINVPPTANVGANVATGLGYIGSGTDYRYLGIPMTFRMDSNFVSDSSTISGSTITVNNAGFIVGSGGIGGAGGGVKSSTYGGGGAGGGGMHQVSSADGSAPPDREIWYGGYGGAAGGSGANKGANTSANWFFEEAAGGSGGGSNLDATADAAKGGYGGQAFTVLNGDSSEAIDITITNHNYPTAWISSGGGGGGGAKTGAGGAGGLPGEAGSNAPSVGETRGLAGRLFYNDDNDVLGPYTWTVDANYHVTGNTRPTIYARGVEL